MGMIVDDMMRTLVRLGLERDYDQWHLYNTMIRDDLRLTLDDYWMKCYGNK